MAWGSVMGSEEASALDAVERALGEAVATGELAPGASRWRSAAVAITERVLTRPLDVPPGQSWASLVTTERVAHWIDSARHPSLGEWRSSVANRLLNPIAAPPDPVGAIAPVHWLSRARWGTWWRRAHAEQLPGACDRACRRGALRLVGVVQGAAVRGRRAPALLLREAAARLRLVRRRGRRLHLTSRGSELMANPAELWHAVAGETEDGDAFTLAVTEVVGLRLIRGRAERDELVADVTPILGAQGWSTASGPITPDAHLLRDLGPSPLVAAVLGSRRGRSRPGSGEPVGVSLPTPSPCALRANGWSSCTSDRGPQDHATISMDDRGVSVRGDGCQLQAMYETRIEAQSPRGQSRQGRDG